MADRFIAVLSFVFAIFGAGLSAYRFYINENDVEFSLPYNQLYVCSALERMALAASVLAALLLAMDWLYRKIAGRWEKLSHRSWGVLKNIFCSLVCLAVLFVPSPNGRYNDGGEDGGGSMIYEARLYEVIDWNRTHYFNGTPFPAEDQQMRIYFFPYNCYDYETKWELKH